MILPHHESPPTAGPRSYLPQLDAVRAFAVMLVLWNHWCGGEHDPFGPIGVWIFFVVSGFLITRILLSARRESARESRDALLKFYSRRALRIFPLYYFVLLLSFALSARFRADAWWYVAHLQNFRMMQAAEPTSIFGVHFWTLAVEQQFYLAWPLIVLFAPRALLLPAIALAVALAVASRWACAAAGWTDFQAYVFTPNNLDTLGCGAILAHFASHRPEKLVRLRRLALGAGLAVFAVTLLVRVPILSADLSALPTGLVALWLIAHVLDGVRGPAGRLFSFPPSIYLGRISYGIYVYHFFVPGALKPLLRRAGVEEGGALFVVACLVVTVAVASVSWFLLEKPIGSLKNRFQLPAGGSPIAHVQRLHAS